MAFKNQLFVFMRGSRSFLLFLFLTVFFHSEGQLYSGTVTHGNSNQYSFDYTIECDVPPGSATLTVDYTTSTPIGLVPQLHLGGGVFVHLAGSGPYTYVFNGLSTCNFNFFFWMAFASGGLYQSPAPVTPSNTPLPITLTDFEAVLINNHSVLLNWETSSEINGHFFDIERAKDNFLWERIGRKEAAGNSSNLLHYSFTDYNVIPINYDSKVYYYRLKQVDLDGTFEYSKIISIRISDDEDITIFPNPANDQVQINLTGITSETGYLRVEVFNGLGSLVMTEEINENNLHKFDINRLQPDIYTIRILGDDRLIFSQRIFKTKR